MYIRSIFMPSKYGTCDHGSSSSHFNAIFERLEQRDLFRSRPQNVYVPSRKKEENEERERKNYETKRERPTDRPTERTSRATFSPPPETPVSKQLSEGKRPFVASRARGPSKHFGLIESQFYFKGIVFAEAKYVRRAEANFLRES